MLFFSYKLPVKLCISFKFGNNNIWGAWCGYILFKAFIHSFIEAGWEVLDPHREQFKHSFYYTYTKYIALEVCKMGQGHENEVWLLGVNMSIKPKWLQLLICAGGLFLGFLVNGVCEVRASPPPKKNLWVLSISLSQVPHILLHNSW